MCPACSASATHFQRSPPALPEADRERGLPQIPAHLRFFTNHKGSTMNLKTSLTAVAIVSVAALAGCQNMGSGKTSSSDSGYGTSSMGSSGTSASGTSSTMGSSSTSGTTGMSSTGNATTTPST